jgi:hypothetical protein
MKTARLHRQAFTLAEVLVAMVGSVIVIGALLAGSIGLQKSFHASESYANDQADERRLIDYVARDLRRSVGIATAGLDGVTRRVSSGNAAVDETSSLVVTLPAYYKSNTPTDSNYDKPLPLIASGDRVAYGSATGPADAFPVTFRKLFIAEEQCVCFVRDEGGNRQVIVRQAEDMQLQVALAADGESCTLTAQFLGRYSRNRVPVEVHDDVMLRNARID